MLRQISKAYGKKIIDNINSEIWMRRESSIGRKRSGGRKEGGKEELEGRSCFGSCWVSKISLPFVALECI